ncbi:hypothetical protein GSI_02776 [Ganoderma sinense ZZ0214-1]|uniref:Uncharacterized protein n=1 Tax=Ganoderma sinense ZZ0214-1 TaxID=1077348 RepID=A0A2G8SML6_9APHY|nr:hypothetical protein GSI_02776 [Ganoderma sinense ZZ0214-1]
MGMTMLPQSSMRGGGVEEPTLNDSSVDKFSTSSAVSPGRVSREASIRGRGDKDDDLEAFSVEDVLPSTASCVGGTIGNGVWPFSG